MKFPREHSMIPKNFTQVYQNKKSKHIGPEKN